MRSSSVVVTVSATPFASSKTSMRATMAGRRRQHLHWHSGSRDSDMKVEDLEVSGYNIVAIVYGAIAILIGFNYNYASCSGAPIQLITVNLDRRSFSSSSGYGGAMVC